MPADSAGATRRTALAVALAVAGSPAACRKTQDVPVAVDAGSNAPAADAGVVQSASAVVGPRCGPEDTSVAMDEARGADVEIGDAVPTANAYALGAVHRTAQGRVAAVMQISRALDTGSSPDASGEPARWLDLAPTLGDAPPPLLVPRPGSPGADLVAAAYLRGGGGIDRGAARNLALYAISSASWAGAPPQPFLIVPQQHDDSLAFDLAFAGSSGVVVWDEGAAPSRGVIRALALEGEAGLAVAHDISPPESDAELPKIEPDGSGFVAMWIARRPEPTRPFDAAEPEVPGETRSFGWLESVRLDARGAVAGPVRALTAASGHVSAYDVVAIASPEHALVVVARDDGESVDGSGGALVRVRIVDDLPESPVEYQSDGLGRGAPAFVEGSGSFLAWVGPAEQARLLSLDRSGAPLGPPSAEDTLNDARPLRVLGGPATAGASARLLVAASTGTGAALRVVVCRRP